MFICIRQDGHIVCIWSVLRLIILLNHICIWCLQFILSTCAFGGHLCVTYALRYSHPHSGGQQSQQNAQIMQVTPTQINHAHTNTQTVINMQILQTRVNRPCKVHATHNRSITHTHLAKHVLCLCICISDKCGVYKRLCILFSTIGLCTNCLQCIDMSTNNSP